MGKKKDDDLQEVEVEVEFKVSMHCNACERLVAKTISNFKGVQKFMTDMNEHKVVVTGRMNPQKLLKKLKKKTGKRVEIVENNEEDDEASKELENEWMMNGSSAGYSQSISFAYYWPPTLMLCDCCSGGDVLLMFSDENPNACSVM